MGPKNGLKVFDYDVIDGNIADQSQDTLSGYIMSPHEQKVGVTGSGSTSDEP